MYIEYHNRLEDEYAKDTTHRIGPNGGVWQCPDNWRMCILADGDSRIVYFI